MECLPCLDSKKVDQQNLRVFLRHPHLGSSPRPNLRQTPAFQKPPGRKIQLLLPRNE